MKKLVVFLAAFAVALPLFSQEQSILRFYNNDAAAARDVAVTCGTLQRVITIQPHTSVDAECSDADYLAPRDVTVVRANASQQWDAVPTDSSCPALQLLLPPFGCVNGNASAAVNDIAGATYSWNVDGATIAGQNKQSHVMLKLGSGDSVKASVTVQNGSCTTTANGVMKLTNPLDINSLDVNAGMVMQPVTITWDYDGTVTSQTLTGTDFGTAISVPPTETSFTYTPIADGQKSVTLTAISEPQSQNTNPGSGGRRRPSHAQPVSATTCGQVTATTQYTVGNCTLPNVVISVPATVKPGATFKAQVHISNTEATPTIKWTITNGTPTGATNAADVTIVAGQTGEVGVAVEVRFSDTCATTVRKKVQINGNCTEPTATVSSGGTTCWRLLLHVKFSGQPPFGGTWSDGVSFTTNATDYTREVAGASPATYTISKFHDAVCDGTVSGSVAYAGRAKATITLVGSKCTNGKIVAKFEGTPPFSGSWSDDLTDFTTNNYTIEHTPVPGKWINFLYFIGNFHDANCSDPNAYDDSNLLLINDPPTATVEFETWGGWTSCSSPSRASIISANVAGDPPIHVKWSDGFVQDSPGTPVYRVIWPEGRTGGSETLKIIELSDRNCPALYVDPGHTVSFADAPLPTHPDVDNFLCSGSTSTASLTKAPPAGVPIVWSIENGEIVSGQGTAAIVWRAGAPGTDVTITCKYDYKNNECLTSAPALPKPHVWAIPMVPKVVLAQNPIAVGGSVPFSITVDENVAAWGASTATGGEITYGSCRDDSWTSHTCSFLYNNTTGAGVKTVTIDYMDRCDKHYKSTFTITVQ